MSERKIKFLKYAGFILLGIFLGAMFFSGEDTVVEKRVEVPVLKTIEKEPADYQKIKHNFSICIQSLELSSEVNIIAGEIFGNLSLYISNPSLLQAKANEVLEKAVKLQELRSHIQE